MDFEQSSHLNFPLENDAMEVSNFFPHSHSKINPFLFQLFLEDLQGMENNNQTQEILTAKFIDACGELKQREFLTKDIYLDFLKRGDIFSDCGDNVRVGINKEFLENICKKLFD